MQCELCSTVGQGGERARCQRCGSDTTLPPDVKRFLISLVGFRPGELLEGRYRIDRILGYGGMSVVYKAHDEVLGEDVAIKVINRGRVGDDNKLVTDIRRDIVTTRKLAHPDIVKIYDFHKTDTCGFLTMEFVPGKDVASLIAERGRLGETEVCRIAAQVAEALHYAHTNGVIHCDIKPANLLLAADGRVKIADFGISRVIHEESSGLTGLVVGTPAYMAPEQIRGERPGPRTDMYALGIVMWHCLMGSPPFTRGDISYQHVHMPLPPLIAVSPELELLIRKAASKSVDDRYPSMDVMARELLEILRNTSAAADATLLQTTQAGLAATLVQTPPAGAAGPAARLPAADTAGTVLQTPPPAPVPAPAMADTMAQIQPPAFAGTVGSPPAPARAPEPPPPRPPDGAPPAGDGGRVPPATAGPAGGNGQEPRESPPASSRIRMACVAAVVVLLAGAAAWGLFSRSPEPDKTGQPQVASRGGLPPAQSPPGVVATVPPPERPPPGGAQPASTSQGSVGLGGAGGPAGAVAAAVVGGRAERLPVAPKTAAGQTIVAPPGLTPATAAVVVSPPPPAVPHPVPASTPLRSAEPQPAPSLQTGTPEPQTPAPPVAPVTGTAAIAVSQPLASAPPPVAVGVQPPAPVSPPAPVMLPAAVTPPTSKPVVETSSVTPPPARDLGLPIQTAAIPGGRWCDLRVRAVGTGLPMATARSEGERRLTAERSADMDAYRRIAEYVKGIQVSGGSTVKDFVTTDASYKTKIDAVLRGARRVDSQKNADGTWSVVMEMNLSGMCDVIQAGTP